MHRFIWANGMHLRKKALNCHHAGIRDSGSSYKQLTCLSKFYTLIHYKTQGYLWDNSK